MSTNSYLFFKVRGLDNGTHFTDHIEDGWRYNAIELLSECGGLTKTLLETIKKTEHDPEILEFANSCCGEL